MSLRFKVQLVVMADDREGAPIVSFCWTSSMREWPPPQIAGVAVCRGGVGAAQRIVRRVGTFEACMAAKRSYKAQCAVFLDALSHDVQVIIRAPVARSMLPLTTASSLRKLGWPVHGLRPVSVWAKSKRTAGCIAMHTIGLNERGRARTLRQYDTRG